MEKTVFVSTLGIRSKLASRKMKCTSRTLLHFEMGYPHSVKNENGCHCTCSRTRRLIPARLKSGGKFPVFITDPETSIHFILKKQNTKTLMRLSL
jgi:hypothetical protein